MSVLPQSKFEVLTQREFLAALHQGRRDFTGVTFNERVNLNQFTAKFADIPIDNLDLSDCNLGPDFGLGDLAVDTLWLERSISAGKVCLYRPTIRVLYAKQLAVEEWFSIVDGSIDGCDLTRSSFAGGFCINRTPIATLILDHCQSAQSLVDETNEQIKLFSALEATLGLRAPTKFSELF